MSKFPGTVSVFIVLGFFLMLVLYIVLPETTLNGFGKLNSEVWGTVSDWIMILVTAFTAIYLIKTFNEQKRSNDISENKDRREIMPIFEVNNKVEFDNDSGEPFFVFTLLNNPAYRVLFRFIDADVESVSAGKIEKDLKPKNIIEIWAGPHIKETVKLYLDPVKIGEVTFQDIDGRTYSQSIFKQGSEYSMSYPRHLK